MGNSAVLVPQLCSFRALQKITRDAEGLLQVYKLGIRNFISISNSTQKAAHKFTRSVGLCRCLRRALLALLAVILVFYQDFCPRTVCKSINSRLYGAETTEMLRYLSTWLGPRYTSCEKVTELVYHEGCLYRIMEFIVQPQRLANPCSLKYLMMLCSRLET